MAWTEINHVDSKALAGAVANAVADTCYQALVERGQAALAVAGGGTPLPIYRRLGHMDMDWPAVTAVPTDERWVASDHPGCNRTTILQALSGTGINLKPLCPDKPEAQPHCQVAQASLETIGVFDGVLVGMGTDGHFASLFPGLAELAIGLDPDSDSEALVVTPDPLPPEAPFTRISLTLARLANTRRLWLAITGENKREILMQAARPDADPHRRPIAALLGHPELRVEVHWSP